MGAVTKKMQKHKTNIRRDRVDINRDQAIVERLNRTLAERLFGHQYAVEIRLIEGQRSSKWVVWLPSVVSALNGEVTRLTGKKPAEATREKAVYSKTCDFLPQTCRGERNTAPLCGGWTNPMSLKAKGKCTISKNPSPNPISRFCIICTMATNGASFARNVLLCLPTPSCHSTYSISYSSACHASSLM